MASRIKQPSIMEILPFDCLREILQYLSPTDLVAWSRTCRLAHYQSESAQYNLQQWIIHITNPLSTEEQRKVNALYSEFQDNIGGHRTSTVTPFFNGASIKEINDFMSSARKWILNTAKQYDHPKNLRYLQILYMTTTQHKADHVSMRQKVNWNSTNHHLHPPCNIIDAALTECVKRYNPFHVQREIFGGLIDNQNPICTQDEEFYMCSLQKQREALYTLNDIIETFEEITSFNAEEKNDMCNFYQALVKLPPITTLIGRVTDIIDLTCNREIIRNYNCYCHKLNFDGTYHHNVGYRPACCANYETNQKLIFVELNIREIREKFEIQSDKSNWQFYSNHSTSVFTPRMRNKLIPVAEKLRNTPLYSCFRTV